MAIKYKKMEMKNGKYKYLFQREGASIFNYRRTFNNEMAKYYGKKDFFASLENKSEWEDFHNKIEAAITLAENEAYSVEMKTAEIFRLLGMTEEDRTKFMKNNKLNIEIETSTKSKGLTTNNLLNDLKRWAKLFIAEKKVVTKRGKAPSKQTLEQYERILNNFFEYSKTIVDGTNIQDIKKEFILGYFLYKEENSTSFNQNSRAAHWSVIQAFLNYISDENEEDINIMKKFKDFKVMTVEKDPEGLTEDEQVKIMFYLEDNQIIKYESNNKQIDFVRNRLMYKAFLFGGFRAAEMMSLSLLDFVLDGDKYSIKFIGKGNKERTVFINKEIIESDIKFLKENNFTHIAQMRNGKIMDRKSIWNAMTNIYKACNINKQGVHILRHTFAQNLVSKNISLSTIQKLLGHSMIETTMIYARTNRTNLKKAAEALI